MEASNLENETTDYLYKDSAKAARIYELILDNINFDKIQNSQIETEELNNIDSAKSLKYIEEVGNKKDETEGKLNSFTKHFKNVIDVLICDIQEELQSFNELKSLNNLRKLSAYYYLFKIQNADDINEEHNYAEKINDVVVKILSNKEYYYNILMLLDHFKNGDISGDNKKAKIDAYFKIIYFLNEKMFLYSLSEYMNDKKTLYQQYNIPLPFISFEEKKDLDKNIKKIYNILYILKISESFKTNERFEYFQVFRYKHELLEEINYILYKLNKKQLISLDKSTDDITQEAIKYSLNNETKQENNEEIISELNKLLDDVRKEKEEIEKEKGELQQKYEQITNKYDLLSQKYTDCINKYTIKLNEFEEKISSLRKKQVESNTRSNQQTSEIESLKTNLRKKEDIIERISYREIGSRIISFFSLSQSEEKKKQLVEKKISPKNISIIMDYMKANLSYYCQYMKLNGVDLTYVLNEIKGEKKNYDKLVYQKERTLEKYIELINANDKTLGGKINFIFKNSKYINDYVFKQDNKITEKVIFEEFKEKDEEFRKIIEDSKKKIEDFN